MCGIAGIISTKGFSPETLFNMSQIQKHRGPDDEGFFIRTKGRENKFLKSDDTIKEKSGLPHINKYKNHDNSIGLAHRRLSIIDLSPAGHQPMQEVNGSNIIVLNGEIYNYIELKVELEKKGYKFRSTSDTEVVLASYREWGESCVDKFIGMWAFAIYDVDQDLIFISRDRFGIKPIYYFQNNDEFIFSSEIKSILTNDLIEKKINSRLLYKYLAYGNFEENEGTLFNDIEELPAGYKLVYKLKQRSINKSSYYNLKDKVFELKPNVISEGNFQEKYNELFRNSISLHLRSDVPIGSCLSGGIDSSAIVASSMEQLDNTVFNTFTSAYKDPKVDESGYAKIVSDHFPNINPHYIYPDSENFWNDLDKLIWHQDLPIGSTSIYSQWEVMKLAKKNGIKVLMDGQGADETLGGYSNFAGVHLLNLLTSFKLKTLISESIQLRNNRQINIIKEVGRAGFYYFPQFIRKKIRRKNREGLDFIDTDYREEFNSEKMPDKSGKGFLDSSIFSINYGLKELLRYEDRNSMAFSIESRVPFLDHRLVEFSLAIPDDLKIRNGWSKLILRESIKTDLDPRIVWRKGKKGFITPQEKWKIELDDKVHRYLNEANFSDFLNKESILKFSKKGLSNNSDLSSFWKVLSVIKWVEIFELNN